MLNKRILIFMLLLLVVNVCYAARISSYDSVAFDVAVQYELEKQDADAVDKFVNEFERAVSYEDTIDMDAMLKKCKEIVKSGKTCIKFINTYNKFLDHANFCKESDKFKAGNFTFNECRSYVLDDDKSYASRDSSGKIYNQCKTWIEHGMRCRFYLMGYYSDQTNNETSESDKEYYQCLSKKIEDGDIDFPMSKMEQDCK